MVFLYQNVMKLDENKEVLNIGFEAITRFIYQNRISLRPLQGRFQN